MSRSDLDSSIWGLLYTCHIRFLPANVVNVILMLKIKVSCIIAGIIVAPEGPEDSQTSKHPQPPCPLIQIQEGSAHRGKGFGLRRWT